MTSSLTRMMHGVVVAAAVGMFGCAAADKEESVGTDRGAYEETGSVTLIRSVSPAGHWVSTGGLPAGAQEQGRYGIRPWGVNALYSCWTGTTTIASTDPGCEGHQRRQTLGYLDAGHGGVRLYRCGWAGNSFITTRSDCEGASLQAVLGYVDWTSTYGSYGSSHEGSGDAPGGGGGGGGDGVGAGGSL